MSSPVPAVPNLSNIQDPEVRTALQALSDGWQVRNGWSGSGDNKFLTQADLDDAVDAKIRKLFGSAAGSTGGGGTGGNPLDWIGDEIKRISEEIFRSWLWRYLNEPIPIIEKPGGVNDMLDDLAKKMADLDTGTTLKFGELRTDLDGTSGWLNLVAQKTDWATGMVLEEITTRATQDTAQATQINALAAQVGESIAGLQSKIDVLVTQNTALVTQLNTLGARLGAAEGGIISEQTARVNQDNAIVQSINTQYSEVQQNLSLLRVSNQTLSNQISTMAQQTTSLQSRVDNINGGGVALEQVLTTLWNSKDDYRASYTLKVQANDAGTTHVAGFGLSIEGSAAGPFSQFLVLADRFAVGSRNSQAAGVIPFIVDQEKVYIDTALIRDASITQAKIGDLWAWKLTAEQIEGDISKLQPVNAGGGSINTNWTEVGRFYIPPNPVTGHKPFAMLTVNANIPGGADDIFARIEIWNSSGGLLAQAEGVAFTNEIGGITVSAGAANNTKETCYAVVQAHTWQRNGSVTSISGMTGGLR